MPNRLHKALQLYFSKAKRASRSSPENSTTTTSSSSHNSSTSWLFSACRFPKTPSFATDRDVDPPTGFHHFNTLFLADGSDDLPEFMSISGSQSSCFSTDSAGVPVDLASSVPSERFLIVPEVCNSIVGDSTGQPATPAILQKETRLVGHSVAVTTYSPDPFHDFRRSMQEMVEARMHEQGIDWEFLEELLFCYLKLNHSRDHRYIFAAFADLLVCLAADHKPGSPLAGASTGLAGAVRVTGHRRGWETSLKENPEGSLTRRPAEDKDTTGF